MKLFWYNESIENHEKKGDVMEEFKEIYKKLTAEGHSAEVDHTELAYLLGAVDALRIFNGFRLPEVEHFHVILGHGGGDLIECLQK